MKIRSFLLALLLTCNVNYQTHAMDGNDFKAAAYGVLIAVVVGGVAYGVYCLTKKTETIEKTETTEIFEKEVFYNSKIYKVKVTYDKIKDKTVIEFNGNKSDPRWGKLVYQRYDCDTEVIYLNKGNDKEFHYIYNLRTNKIDLKNIEYDSNSYRPNNSSNTTNNPNNTHVSGQEKRQEVTQFSGIEGGVTFNGENTDFRVVGGGKPGDGVTVSQFSNIKGDLDVNFTECRFEAIGQDFRERTHVPEINANDKRLCSISVDNIIANLDIITTIIFEEDFRGEVCFDDSKLNQSSQAPKFFHPTNGSNSIVFKIEEGTLRVKFNNIFGSDTEKNLTQKIVLYLPSLSKFRNLNKLFVQGQAQIKGPKENFHEQKNYTFEKFSLEVIGGGSVEASLNAEKLTISTKGSSKVNLAIRAKMLESSFSDAGAVQYEGYTNEHLIISGLPQNHNIRQLETKKTTVQNSARDIYIRAIEIYNKTGCIVYNHRGMPDVYRGKVRAFDTDDSGKILLVQ